MTLGPDERLALAYRCAGNDTTQPIANLPAEDRLAICSHLADIRTEQRRIAAGLIGHEALGEPLERITK